MVLTYARIVDAKFKPGTRDEAIEIVNKKGPAVENPDGYEGLLILTPTDDPNRVLFISLWDSEETMMDSEKGVVRRVMEATRSIQDGQPDLKHYKADDKLTLKQVMPT